MEKVKYANIANELLGNEMYSEFVKEISKEHGDANLVEFGEEVLNKACFLIVMIGMSKKIKLDNHWLSNLILFHIPVMVSNFSWVGLIMLFWFESKTF